MILKQYYLGCLAHASYLLGDEASATGIVVDPQRDIQQYLTDAEKLGLQIRHVFLTHFHADFVAGHLELRDRCGAAIHLGSRAQAEYAFVPMQDGDALEFPGLRLKVLETPGHTREDITTLVRTDDGLVACTHLWWSASGPAEDPLASDPSALHRNRVRVLQIAALIVPGHGAAFKPTPETPR